MSELERDQLRERVASGVATGEERDRLASILARAIRSRDADELDAIEVLIDELRTLASAGSDRTSCTDALAGALLDAQIRAFERRDAADAWRRLDELRARLYDGGTPDLLQDRLAAALYNMVRGGELLEDEPMRLAALYELRMRAFGDPSAGACRVALAELLADEVGRGIDELDRQVIARSVDELERLRALDSTGLAIAREYGRALAQLLAAELEPAVGWSLERLRGLSASFERASGDAIRVQLASALASAHSHALRTPDEHAAESALDELRALERALAEGGRTRARARAAVVRELGRALHDGLVLRTSNLALVGTLEAADVDARVAALEQCLDTLDQLRTLEQTQHDLELRGRLMSALLHSYRALIEHDLSSAASILSEADVLLERDFAAAIADEQSPNVHERTGASARLLGARVERRSRAARVRVQLRLDYLRLLQTAHARAGDRAEWERAERLLMRARSLVERMRRHGEGSFDAVELFGQMLVNAHVDAGAAYAQESSTRKRVRARALLDELRELADTHAEAEALQLHHATALFNAHVDAGRRLARSEADELLAELELRCARHPELLELRRRLAMALVNHHGDLLEHDDVTQSLELLERLRTLVRSPDADDHMRVQLAMALGNALAHVEDPVEDELGQLFIGELRVLASHPQASDTLRTLVLDELSELFAPKQ